MTHIKITGFNKKGWGKGHSSEDPSSSVEVIGGVPGDLVDVTLQRGRRRGKRRGTLLSVVDPSPLRVEPRCRHVPFCGGCVWQQLSYVEQLKEKERRLVETFSPLLSSFPDALHPIVPCDTPWEYRNKMEFSFSQDKSGRKFLGLIMGGSRGWVLDLTECHLTSSWGAMIVNAVRSWWEGSSLSAYRFDDTGALRTLIIREGKRTGDRLILLTVSGNPAFALSQSHLQGFIQAVLSVTPKEKKERTSIFLRVQQQLKKHPTQFYEIHLFGPDHFTEILHLPQGELKFKISPTSFFQPNPSQAEKFYGAAFHAVATNKEHILDLYAGTATLGMVLAPRAKKVTAIEINPYACFDAQANVEFNGISHLQVICADVGKALANLKEEIGFTPPDLVVIDPPRAGLGAQAINHLKALRPQEILYISCQPKTKSADLQELLKEGYSLLSLQPFDQFPHTPHLETLAHLRFFT